MMSDEKRTFAMQGLGDYAEADVASSRKARDFKDGTDLVAAVDCRNLNESESVSGTLQSKNNGGYSLNYTNPVRCSQKVRRLTPLECTRLQGFPDGWVAIDGTKDTCGDVVRVTFPFLAVARRSILRGPGVPTERLGKIGLYLNLFYAPYFCRCLGLEE